MTSAVPRFQSADYAVFVCLIVASTMVGIVQGIVDAVRKKQKKGEETGKEETIVDSRNLSVWPASLGVIASSSAAPFVLGCNIEMFTFGTEFSLVVIGVVIGVPLLTHLLYARMHRLKMTSLYEYFEYRFHKRIRLLCSLLYVLVMIVGLGIVTYAPGTALGQVTGLPIQATIPIVGAIAITYTTIGSLKHTLWVDGVQMLLLLASFIAIIVQGTNEVGGISEVWTRAYNGGRIQFNVIDPNPLVRTSLWTQAIGGTFSMMVLFTQPAVGQKYLRLKTLKDLYITAYLSVFIKCFYTWIFCLCGIVMYAYFANCSPIVAGQVPDANSLLPFFVVSIFHKVPGVSGLFMAALVSACLSVIAAILNALTSITVVDAIRPLYLKKTGKKQMNSLAVSIVYKCGVVIYGIVGIALGYAAPSLGPNILTVVLNLVSVVTGPILGLFIMGVCMPWVNAWGAGAGLLVSVAFEIWLSVGALFTEAKYHLTAKSALKQTIAGCPKPTVPAMLAGNVTAGMFTTGVSETWTATANSMVLSDSNVTAVINAAATAAPVLKPSNFEMFYYTSYMWYSLIAVLVAIVVGCLVTAISEIVARIIGANVSSRVDPALSFMCGYKPSQYTVKEADEIKETQIYPERYHALPETQSQVTLKSYDNNGFQNGKREFGISAIAEETPYSKDEPDDAIAFAEDYIGHPQAGGVEFENYDYK